MEGDKQVVLNVGGLNCEMCVKMVARALKTIDGVHHVHIDADEEWAEVKFDQQKVSVEQLKQAVIDAGYEIL